MTVAASLLTVNPENGIFSFTSVREIDGKRAGKRAGIAQIILGGKQEKVKRKSNF
jgi:hypothetical protein